MWEDSARGDIVNTANNGSGIGLARGRRAQRAQVKPGMRGSCTRISQHRLKTCNLTNRGMEPNELLDHLKQRRGNDKEMKKEEMDKLLKDVHKEEKAIKEERDEIKKRHSVMTINMQMHGN